MKSKRRETAGILLRGFVALALFAVAVWKYDTLSNIDVQTLVSGLTNTAAIIGVVIGIYVVKSVVFVIPASVVYVAVGAILEPFTAVTVNVVGIALEVLITYFLGRFLGSDYVERLLSKNKGGRKLLDMKIQDRKAVIFTVRLLPAFPIDFTSLFFGASHCNFPLYMLLSVLGIAPRVILFTLLGDGIFAWIPLDKIIFVVICCVPVGVAVYFIKKFVIDKKKKNPTQEEPGTDGIATRE